MEVASPAGGAPSPWLERDMFNGAWEAILRQIPADQQDQYMLVTASGTEIALQSFLRIETELVVVKGRLSGSQEQNRVFFIPYKHIDYFGTAKPVKDTEFQGVFGSLTIPAARTAAAGEPLPPEPTPVDAAHANGSGSNGSSQRAGIRS